MQIHMLQQIIIFSQVIILPIIFNLFKRNEMKWMK